MYSLANKATDFRESPPPNRTSRIIRNKITYFHCYGYTFPINVQSIDTFGASTVKRVCSRVRRAIGAEKVRRRPTQTTLDQPFIADVMGDLRREQVVAFYACYSNDFMVSVRSQRSKNNAFHTIGGKKRKRLNTAEILSSHPCGSNVQAKASN